MSKTALNAVRSDMYNIRFDNETISIRMIDDPDHPDYDPRVDLPVDSELMESMRMVGQLEPASGYKGDVEGGRQVVYLVFGRQRWKAIRAIWDEMLEKGDDMELAPAFKLVLQRTEDATKRRQKRIIENRHRQGLEGLALAREVANHLEIVGEDEQSMEHARILFNFKSRAALDNCLSLLDTTAKVQEKIADGTISPTGALQLSRQSAKVQNAVVDRIESGEAEGGEEAPQIDAFREEFPAPPAEAPAKATKSVSVSGIKEMIREQNGQANHNLVTLKQIEKEIERKEKAREKLFEKLEASANLSFYSEKTQAAIAEIANIGGYIEALRWARGESTVADKSTSNGNDKASAAFDALRDSILSAPWPEFVEIDEGDDKYQTDDNPADYDLDVLARDTLSIANEDIAIREQWGEGFNQSIKINVKTKWFTRLMDPFGDPKKLVREWCAYGWIASSTHSNTSLVERVPFLKEGRVAIRIEHKIVNKWNPMTATESDASDV